MRLMRTICGVCGLILVLATASGCPAKFVDVGPITGRVVDQLQQPVSDATIRAIALNHTETQAASTSQEGEVLAEARSGPDGIFTVPEVADWGVYLVPMDYWPRPVRLRVTSPDGGSAELDTRHRLDSHIKLFGLGATPAFDLGDIRLKSQ